MTVAVALSGSVHTLEGWASQKSVSDVFGDSWAGRRVTVLGLARSGVAAAELLCRIGCRVGLSELRDTPATRSAQAILRERGIEVVELGGHSRELITASDLVVVSPGISETAEPVVWARELGLPVLSEIELAFHFCPVPVVAVTGTNGKSTVVTLIAEVLRSCGRQAIACGNLGLPFSAVIGRFGPKGIAVVEVSSFQLLHCERFRPRIGVLLNLGTNHLDRHPNWQTYCEAKRRLFQAQTQKDWAVLNGTDTSVVALGEGLLAQRVWFGQNRSNGPDWFLSPKTQASLSETAQAVLQVARILDIPDPLTWQVIRSFRGLEHRLEPVATIRGIRFINDSKSTTPESLLYALKRLSGELVLIIGGRDKGLNFQPLIAALKEPRIKGLVLIGESRRRLRQLLDEALLAEFVSHGRSVGASSRSVWQVRECDSLEQALEAAISLAHPGTTVLFSPACASFDMFQDFEQRGQRFKAIVQKLVS